MEQTSWILHKPPCDTLLPLLLLTTPSPADRDVDTAARSRREPARPAGGKGADMEALARRACMPRATVCPVASPPVGTDLLRNPGQSPCCCTSLLPPLEGVPGNVRPAVVTWVSS